MSKVCSQICPNSWSHFNLCTLSLMLAHIMQVLHVFIVLRCFAVLRWWVVYFPLSSLVCFCNLKMVQGREETSMLCWEHQTSWLTNYLRGRSPLHPQCLLSGETLIQCICFPSLCLLVGMWSFSRRTSQVMGRLWAGWQPGLAELFSSNSIISF